MPVTILEVRNRGSRWEKTVIFEHEEDLGVIRKRIAVAARAALKKRFEEGKANPLCFDDIWADIEEQLSPCLQIQFLDLQELLGLPSEAIKIDGLLPGMELY